MVNSQHKHVKNCFPDISFMRPITDLFGSNRNVPVRDPCHSRMWLWTSPWMSGYNWLTRRGACTRLWCRRTAVAWSQRVSGRPCGMPHQRAFLFLFLAAKIDGPWWSVMIFAGTSVSSAGAGCSHWAQRSFLCSHLPNERLRWHLHPVAPEAAPSLSFRGPEVQCLTLSHSQGVVPPSQRWSPGWSKGKSRGHWKVSRPEWSGELVITRRKKKPVEIRFQKVGSEVGTLGLYLASGSLARTFVHHSSSSAFRFLPDFGKLTISCPVLNPCPPHLRPLFLVSLSQVFIFPPFSWTV